MYYVRVTITYEHLKESQLKKTFEKLFRKRPGFAAAIRFVHRSIR